MKRIIKSGRWGFCLGVASLLLLSIAGLQPAYAVYHAMLVGIDAYSPAYGPTPLGSCINDANGMRAKLLADTNLWKTANISTKLNGAATKALILSRMRAEAAVLHAGDVFVYFHSSHGGRVGTSATAYLCTYNASFYDTELAAELARFNSGVKIFVILDTCFSGGMFKSATGGDWSFADNVMAEYQKIVAKSNDPDKQAKALGANIAFLTASDWNQTSYAGSPYSRYTRYLIEACNLPGTDNNPTNGYRSFWEAHTYAWPRVTGQSPQFRNYSLLKATTMMRVVLAKPTPIGPTGTASPRPLFSWTAVSGATCYEVQVFNGSGQLITFQRYIGATTWRFATGLADGSYHFRVRAYRGTLAGPWSDYLYFTTSPSGFYIRRATLTWGANPRDLDSHMVTPTGAHIYYSSKGSRTSAPWTQLDVDDTTSYGPENISVYQFTPVGSAVYKYYVYLYAGTGSLATSGARVSVQGPGTVLRNFTCPGGSSTARYWHVFNMTSAGTVIPVNVLRATAP